MRGRDPLTPVFIYILAENTTDIIWVWRGAQRAKIENGLGKGFVPRWRMLLGAFGAGAEGGVGCD